MTPTCSARSASRPDLTAGHSYGELAALAGAGVVRRRRTCSTLSDARGQAIVDAAAGRGDDPGTMAAVAGRRRS